MKVTIGIEHKTRTHKHTQTNTLLDRVVHGLADVQHGVEDDRVFGGLHLVSAGDKTDGDAFF